MRDFIRIRFCFIKIKTHTFVSIFSARNIKRFVPNFRAELLGRPVHLFKRNALFLSWTRIHTFIKRKLNCVFFLSKTFLILNKRINNLRVPVTVEFFQTNPLFQLSLQVKSFLQSSNQLSQSFLHNGIW